MTQTFTTRPEIRGTFGAVASTHWIGSAVGFGILEKGGNAFDAAVATAFTLQIVEPHLNGPGGEVPIIVHPAGADRPRVLCGQGVAPRAATIARLRDMGVDRMPGTGLLPAVVPGAFGAWMELLRVHGTMRIRDVLEPAIGYARDGFPLVRRAAESIHAIAPFFRAEWKHSAEVWLPGGNAPAPGARVAQPQIAETWSRILAEAEAAGTDREAQIEAAARAFYEGFVADAVDRFYRTEQADGAGARHPGLLSGADMASWRPAWEDPVSIDFAGVTVHKTGPWGQGPALLLSLRILDALGIADIEPGSAAWVQRGVGPRHRRDPEAVPGRPGCVVRGPGPPSIRRAARGAAFAELRRTTHYVNSFAPRAFVPGVVHIEERFPRAVCDELTDRGHYLQVEPPWSLGRLCAAGFTRSGLVRAAATPRFMQAYAVGR